MPTFEYECKPCGITKEFQERYEIGPACEQCDLNMSRVWTANPVHFKGGGWGGNHVG